MVLEPLHYRKTRIQKNKHKHRNIYIPSPQYKSFLRGLLPYLKQVYLHNRVFDCDHAFLEHRNCVTNAKHHIKHRYVMCLDIENFFESIPRITLEKYLPTSLLDRILVDNMVVQGFPTSPIISNIAMIDYDFKIIMAIRKINPDFNYSRYADDLTVSGSDKETLLKIQHVIEDILQEGNLLLNRKKTVFYDKSQGRAIITGIGVSQTTIHPTRKILKKIRAAAHQGNLPSLKGLMDWSLCKLPTLER